MITRVGINQKLYKFLSQDEGKTEFLDFLGHETIKTTTANHELTGEGLAIKDV